ncbi:MAG: PAS domain S-box protein, partial [Bryobacteraceae bacterium]|nr:PAS domain S-box protein [Bryobacteraceae bacterium]
KDGAISRAELESSVIHPEDLASFRSEMECSIESGLLDEMTLRILRSDGEVGWVQVSGRFEYDADGTPRKLIGVARDITSERRAEAALRRSESRLRRLVESGIIGVMYWDLDGSVLDANNEFLKMVGFTRGELENGDIDWRAITPPEWQSADAHGIGQLLNVGKMEPFEKEYVRKDGTRVPVLLAGAMFEDSVRQGVILVQDITARKDAERELNKTNDALRRANADLEQFAYSASHDLKEPLRMVGAFSQLLQRRYQGKLDGKADEYLSFCVEGVHRMEDLIRDLLAFTQAAMPSERFAVPPVDTVAVLGRALENLQASIEETDAVVTHDTLPSLQVEAIHLQQLFQNLIGNAIKYRKLTEIPRVHISCARENGAFIVSVRDNGLGIDSRYKDQIFGLFKRLKDSADTTGTGIGLAICQKLVERYNGRIWVDSEVGAGSTFHVLFPFEQEVTAASST